MAHHIEKETGDLIFDGWEKGIAPSPHVGIANMKGVDINTEEGEVMVAYGRGLQSQSQVFSSGTFTQVNTNTISFSGSPPIPGSWITVSGSTISGLANGTYYVLDFNKLSGPSGASVYGTSLSSQLTGMGSGSANWTLVFGMSLPVQGATERYVDTTGTTQYRYYVLDDNGRLWVRDTFQLTGVTTPDWFLPLTDSAFIYNGSVTTVGGLAVYFGYVFIFTGNKIFTVSTSQLGKSLTQFSAGSMLSSAATSNSHKALATHQDILYYPDGSYVGSIVADVQVDPDLTTAIPNIQSYGSYTASTTTGTITAILNGSLPTTATTGIPARIPAYFFPAYGGTKPAAITLGTKYYIQYVVSPYGTFQVYTAQTGGSGPLDMQTGAVGIQYFNTFFPQSGDGNGTLIFTPQRLSLPSFERATCIAELSNTILVGTESNILYPWNQVDTFSNDLISMPENYTSSMVTVNNVVYVFAGFRGNIYISNASAISLALSVPDYTSGLIEPYFTWGGSMFLRGRVYFSIQDQTASHTGQCGGIWSFVPLQNFSYGQDFGVALRIDGISSYNSYNGRTTVFLANQNQQARGPQYWSAWVSSTTSPVYGIDYSSTSTGANAIIETDIVETGTYFKKRTFKQIEYKLSAPLVGIESLSIAYRTDLSSAFASAGTIVAESATELSGYLTVDFQKTQWLQLQITLTTNGNTFTFIRLTELRVR